MKGFPATVKTGTGSDKIAELELENGEIIDVYDGKMRLEGSEGIRFKIKCVASVENIAAESEEMAANGGNGIRRDNGNNSAISVAGTITDDDARSKWMESKGKPLIEIDTDMGQVALRRNTILAADNYDIENGDRINVLCDRFIVVDTKRMDS